MPIFPPNPTDGMMIEPVEGTFYRWSAKEGTWIKLDGYDNIVELATPLQDGYMSSDDYNKIIGLLLPPPKTALSGQDCSFIFDKGIFGFASTKEHLNIVTELPLYQKDKNGYPVETTHVWQIHENTYGMYFGVNINSLVEELENRGQLRYNKSIGPQGKKGARGEPGIDRLDTGPVGPKGEQGQNMPFDGTIVGDAVGLVPDGIKGVVDISSYAASPTENYLIVTRANIGDTESCPKFIQPTTSKSPWIIAFDERPDTRRVLIECNAKQCGEDNCGFLGVGTQAFCASRLFYLDITSIEEAVKSRYEELLMLAKTRKEQVVNEWLTTLISVFNEQKQALCCAIENCESRRENDRHKERIEGLRVQAAASNNKLLIDGDAYREYVDTDPGKTCDATHAQVLTATLPCEVNLIVNCKEHAPTVMQASSVELPAGRYSIRYDRCCGYNGIVDPFTFYNDRNELRACDLLFGQRRNIQDYQALTIGSDNVPAVYGNNKALRIDFGISFQNQTLLENVRIPALRVGSGQALVASVYTRGSDGKPATKIRSATIRYEAIVQWQATQSLPSASQFTEISFNFNKLSLNAGDYFISFWQEIVDGSIANNPYVVVALSQILTDVNNQFYATRTGNPFVQITGYQPTMCVHTEQFITNPPARDIVPKADYDAMYANPDLVPPDFKIPFASMTPYSNSLIMVYQGLNGAETIVTGNSRFRDNKSAQNDASQKVYTIDHYGGTFSAYFTEGTPDNIEKENDGEFQICLSRTGTLVVPTQGDDNCTKPYLVTELSCALNYSELTAVLVDLPADEYVAVISDCCCAGAAADGSVGHQGRISIKYVSSSGDQILSTPDFGTYDSADAAEKMYLGGSFCFIHNGGVIKIWTITPLVSSGLVTVSIYRKVCLETSPPTEFTTDLSAVPDTPFTEFTNCDMNLDQVDFYECGWLSGGCCGVWLKAGGTMWIIVKRSIGDDASCGGGESQYTDCIAKGLLGGFHPAIAFPTSDGTAFLGKPTPGNYMRFVRDVDLEAQIMAQLRAGGPDIYKIVGDPLNNFEAIIFPTAS